MKYLYAVHQVTPPATPQLETDIKQIWGVDTGKRAVEALTAKQEDMVDEVLGKPPVVRCRVCHKPSETGVHPECQTLAFSCTAKRVQTDWVPDHLDRDMAMQERCPAEAYEVVGCGHTAELPPVTLPRTLTTQHDMLRLADAMFCPILCPQCGIAGTTTLTDCPECRPGSSKVSRKRQHQ